ncbi:hypothetical protein O1M63_19620 [Streptomyces mirabilis]|nr:hypothetical protein [Streptomyces mirabilis]
MLAVTPPAESYTVTLLVTSTGLPGATDFGVLTIAYQTPQCGPPARVRAVPGTWPAVVSITTRAASRLPR